jgi:glutathione S-transferase
MALLLLHSAFDHKENIPMQLYGSTTSPYVRRLCLWLNNDEYEFVKIDIFSRDGRKLLKANNPALKIPMLRDGEQTVCDSNVIFRYLNDKFNRESRSWDDENTLTVINAANDSFVELLLLSRSGIETDSDLMFVKLQRERTVNIMQVLDEKVKQGEFEQWNYNAISLFCLVDWVQFRQLCNTDKYEALNRFVEQHKGRPEVIETDPGR